MIPGPTGIIGREILTANRTYYVRTDGSDLNNGLADTAGGAWLTLQHAVNIVYGAIDLNTFDVTVQVRDGTFAGCNIDVPHLGAPGSSITLLGNAGTPINVIITGTVSFEVHNAAKVTLNGFQTDATAVGIWVYRYGNVSISNINFAAETIHIACEDHGMFTSFGTGITISGSANYFASVNNNAVFLLGGIVTIAGAPAWGVAFASVTGNAYAEITALFGGASTGKRFEVTTNAILNTITHNEVYLPGDASGTQSTGGRYIISNGGLVGNNIVPMPLDGDDGEDGPIGPPGPQGPQGPAGGGGGSATTVEVNLSATATWCGKFTITDAAISGTSKVLVWQAPGPYTGKGTRADEAEMQPVSIIAAGPGAGSATVYWQTPPYLTRFMEPISQYLQTGTTNIVSNPKDPQSYSRGYAKRIGKVRGNVKFTYMVM